MLSYNTELFFMSTLRKCEFLVFAHAQVSFHHSGFLHFLETRVSLSKGEPLATILFALKIIIGL